ncbi:excalibur calcium-binding domain-containing protein [Nakamurella flavida]|uniref:excalibur calcium-binding domain-containing protein n=1 Tax=Nakamurella flavida TaxID=363630 RepID=UPI0027D87C7F|nr:excalibur calcium-binding domain-containing protein [Nakamurella flavida]
MVAGAVLVLALIGAISGGGGLVMLGLLVMIAGIVAVVIARPSWGPLASRKVGGGVAGVGLVLALVGGGSPAVSAPVAQQPAAVSTITTLSVPTTVTVPTTVVVTTTVVSTAPAPPPVTVTQTETVTLPAPAAAAVEEPAAVAAAPEAAAVVPQTQAAPRTQAAPQPLVAPAPQTQEQQQSAYYANCSAAEAAGAAPVYRGDPGYSSKLDRDGDGVGCES